MADRLAASSVQRVFLTGEPGSGKTTVLTKAAEVLSSRGLRVGGMISNEVREEGIRVGFSIEDVRTHQLGTLADVTLSQGPRIGKYTVNLNDLESVGAAGIRNAIESAEVILIDEIGPMELKSIAFVESVQAALTSGKHILGTIHRRASHNLILEVKSNPQVAILVVTRQNRDQLPVQIANRIRSAK